MSEDTQIQDEENTQEAPQEQTAPEEASEAVDPKPGADLESPVELNEVEEIILQVIQNWDMKAPEDEGYSEGRPHHAIKIYHAIAPIIRAE